MSFSFTVLNCPKSIYAKQMTCFRIVDAFAVFLAEEKHEALILGFCNCISGLLYLFWLYTEVRSARWPEKIGEVCNEKILISYDKHERDVIVWLC